MRWLAKTPVSPRCTLSRSLVQFLVRTASTFYTKRSRIRDNTMVLPIDVDGWYPGLAHSRKNSKSWRRHHAPYSETRRDKAKAPCCRKRDRLRNLGKTAGNERNKNVTRCSLFFQAGIESKTTLYNLRTLLASLSWSEELNSAMRTSLTTHNFLHKYIFLMFPGCWWERE